MFVRKLEVGTACTQLHTVCDYKLQRMFLWALLVRRLRQSLQLGAGCNRSAGRDEQIVVGVQQWPTRR